MLPGPKFHLSHLPVYLLAGAIGAAIAGLYGIVHDQVTYSISEEYFTKLKYGQFRISEVEQANPRVAAAKIGFLATWWVGMIAGWMCARFSVLPDGRILPLKTVIRQFILIFVVAILFGIGGWLWGLSQQGGGYAKRWTDWMNALGIENQDAFMTVGSIHNAGYAGALTGLIVAIFLLHREKYKASI